MVIFPNCKINLGLHVVRKRPDNYHDIESVFYPLPLKDVLEVVESTQDELHVSGLPLPGAAEENLCIKACNLVRNDFPQLPALAIHLYKHMPAGSGLGGGSADGAFTLMLLNEKFKLGLSSQQLLGYASLLGSDCPFFIINKPCLVTGRGEILESVPPILQDFSVVLVLPGIHINTRTAFESLSLSTHTASVQEACSRPIETWKDTLSNDFEDGVTLKFPLLANIKKTLYRSGALYASMSGSGSGFYGIFEKNKIPSFSFDPDFRVVILK